MEASFAGKESKLMCNIIDRIESYEIYLEQLQQAFDEHFDPTAFADTTQAGSYQRRSRDALRSFYERELKSAADAVALERYFVVLSPLVSGVFLLDAEVDDDGAFGCLRSTHGVFDLGADEILFPAPREFLVMGGRMRAQMEERMARGRLQPFLEAPAEGFEFGLVEGSATPDGENE